MSWTLASKVDIGVSLPKSFFFIIKLYFPKKYKPRVCVCIKVLNPLFHYLQRLPNRWSKTEHSKEMLLSLTEMVSFQSGRRF